MLYVNTQNLELTGNAQSQDKTASKKVKNKTQNTLKWNYVNI